MGLSACSGIAFIIATIVSESCQPLSNYINSEKNEHSRTCIDFKKEVAASAIINIILDGLITLLPVTQV